MSAMKTQPHLDVERQEPLDPADNLQIPEHSDIQAAAFATIGVGLVVPLVALGGMLIFQWLPDIEATFIALFIWIGTMTIPWFTVAYLHARRMFWHDRHRRKLLYWTEERLRRDIDGDGAIGIVLHDNNWFTEAVRYWHTTGDTTLGTAQRDLRMSYEQWLAARDALIRSGAAVSVKRQGKGHGFQIKHSKWPALAASLPPAPQVYVNSVTPPAGQVYARDERISTLKD